MPEYEQGQQTDAAPSQAEEPFAESSTSPGMRAADQRSAARVVDAEVGAKDDKLDADTQAWIKARQAEVKTLKNAKKLAGVAAQAEEMAKNTKISKDLRVELHLLAASARGHQAGELFSWKSFVPLLGNMKDVSAAGTHAHKDLLGAIGLAPDSLVAVKSYARTLLAMPKVALSKSGWDTEKEAKKAVELLGQWPKDPVCVLVRMKLAATKAKDPAALKEAQKAFSEFTEEQRLAAEVALKADEEIAAKVDAEIKKAEQKTP